MLIKRTIQAGEAENIFVRLGVNFILNAFFTKTVSTGREEQGQMGVLVKVLVALLAEGSFVWSVHGFKFK